MSKYIELLKNKYEPKIKDESTLEEYIKELTELVYRFQDENQIDNLSILIQLFEKLMNDYSSNKLLQANYGQTVVNSLPLFFAEGTPIESIKIINNLRSYAYRNNNKILIEFLAMTLTNAIYDFSLIRKINSIREFGMELIDLARKYPEEEKIQIACAKGLMNATMFFLQNNDKEAASIYYQQLIKIIDNHPGNDMVDSMHLIQLKEYFK